MSIERFVKVKYGTAYAIKDESSGLYFAWCYRSETMAEAVANRLGGPTSDTDRAANWKSNIQHCTPSSRSLTKILSVNHHLHGDFP